jgi:hypothetical protein
MGRAFGDRFGKLGMSALPRSNGAIGYTEERT